MVGDIRSGRRDGSHPSLVLSVTEVRDGCHPSLGLCGLMAETESFLSWRRKTKKSANFWLEGLETV